MSLDPNLRAATVAVTTRLADHGITLDAYAAFVVLDALEPYVVTSISKHDQLVTTALGNRGVMGHVRDSKKINAIKDLRQATSCSLKEAKEAIEDDRVWGSYAGSQWSSYRDPNEPPF